LPKGINGIEGNLRKGNLKALLNFLKNLLVILVADEGDRKTLGTETTGTTNTVQVRVGVGGEIVVDGEVNTLDINTTAEDISGNTDALVELLELLVALDTILESANYCGQCRTRVNLPLLLADTRVNCNTGEVALAQQLVQLVGTLGALNKDDHLVELEVVQKLIQLTVLFLLVKLDVILLQSVEGELGIVIDIDLQRVTHELLANGSDLLGEGGTEHHDLLVGGRGTEDFLNITAHV
jgi:hypothetical protein